MSDSRTLRHTYVVTYKATGREVNKLIRVNDKDELLRKAKCAFNVNNDCFLEYYDELCDVYIEPESSDELPDEGKIRLIPRKTERERVESISTLPTEPVLFMDSSCYQPDPQSDTSLSVQLLASEPVASEAAPSTAVTSAPVQGASEDRQEEQGAPGKCENRTSYLNPASLTRNLRATLEAGDSKLKVHQYSQIMDNLFENFTAVSGTDTPTKTQYDMMVGEVLDAFPKIRGNLSFVECMALLKRMLRDKFRNKRAAQRKRSLSPSAPTGSAKKRRQVLGLPGYQPECKMGSVELQIKVNEIRTAELDEDKRRLMEETYPGRRRAIVVEGATVEEVHRDYPPLFTLHGFQDELDRLAEKRNFFITAVQLLEDKLAEIQRKLKSPPDQIWHQLCKQLGSSVDSLLEGEEEPAFPHIRGSDVYAGATKVVTCSSKVELVAALVLAYSVFNVSFPKKHAAVLHFVQRHVFYIDDGVKPPSKCLKFIQQL